jgi:uncharacterized membrane protein
MAESTPVIRTDLDSPRIRTVTLDHPWMWVMAGWRDLRKAPLASIAYGAIFVLMGYYLTSTMSGMFHMSLVLGSGFFLVGPFLAMGLYDISQRLEAGEPATLGHALTAWRSNTTPVLLFGLAVGLIMIVWVRLSSLIFAVIFSDSEAMVGGTTGSLFFSGDGLSFLIVFTIIGALLATLVFAISVVSIPMLLDRHCDIVMALLTSVAAVRLNLGPMILWAALIVVFTGAGLATFYMGLAVTLPLIGHATWHAYKDVVEWPSSASPGDEPGSESS